MKSKTRRGGYSWLLSPFLYSGTILLLASVLYVVVTVGFVIGWLGYAFRQNWWETVVIGATLLSTLVTVTTWDGEFDLLVEKGAAGVVINIGLLARLLAFG